MRASEGTPGAVRDGWGRQREGQDAQSIVSIPEDRLTSNYAISARVIDSQVLGSGNCDRNFLGVCPL